jgi:hypothetical protein
MLPSETPLKSSTPADDRLKVRARVRKYRAKLDGQHCRRLEVCIGVTVIENIRRIARYKRQQTWAVIQQALETYVSAYVQENHLPVRRPEPGSYIKRIR